MFTQPRFCEHLLYILYYRVSVFESWSLKCLCIIVTAADVMLQRGGNTFVAYPRTLHPSQYISVSFAPSEHAYKYRCTQLFVNMCHRIGHLDHSTIFLVTSSTVWSLLNSLYSVLIYDAAISIILCWRKELIFKLIMKI